MFVSLQLIINPSKKKADMVKRCIFLLFLIIFSIEGYAQVMGGNASRSVTVMVGNTVFSKYGYSVSGVSTGRFYPKNAVAPVAGIKMGRDFSNMGFGLNWHFQLLAGMETYGDRSADTGFFRRDVFVDPSLGFDLGWNEENWSLYASFDMMYRLNINDQSGTSLLVAPSLNFRYDITDDFFAEIQARYPMSYWGVMAIRSEKPNVDVLVGLGFRM